MWKASASLIAAAVLLAACTPPEPLDFSLNQVPVSNGKIPCKLQSITVNVENQPDYGDGQYGTRPTALVQFKDPMKSALEDGLDRSASFDYKSSGTCSVDAKILGMKYEGAGITFPTNIYIEYQIMSLDSGSPVFSTIVSGYGQTDFGYNFIGVIRARHSMVVSGEDAVRNMISATEGFASHAEIPKENASKSSPSASNSIKSEPTS